MSDTTLCAQLKNKGVTDVYTCGIAYDVCVGEYEKKNEETKEVKKIQLKIVHLFLI